MEKHPMHIVLFTHDLGLVDPIMIFRHSGTMGVEPNSTTIPL